ncbi:hypothetical protein EST38_g12114 [Candolleomyces aberdarensis]|uniref:Uncharacterized protein n=1 Tax=Candolleomyces aberdarensis TaxID=2316362 RepID=A0A4Q2D3X7_9AGAR|nr:hypothetical protein EST38_g12114 [Candolleomyces aberdarensis]
MRNVNENSATPLHASRFSVGDKVALAEVYDPVGQPFRADAGTEGLVDKKIFSERRDMWMYDIKAGGILIRAVPQDILKLLSAGDGSN